jgi:hypothetical protein
MDNVKLQLVDKLKAANNILVTVSRDPSVDQLSALLGLTLLLNKFDKHAAAVFSGAVPSTIEFLKPEETIEKNTDSLRDFIIALDKSKADKLRYKVEDDVVRIFITPYRTSISQNDLDFSQGDFNVDVVVALGVERQEDLDEAITAHGRILHDATVTSITTTAAGDLGSINWRVPEASSLSELVTELGQALAPDLIDNQTATALLTGIVAETERFSNHKTTAQTMSASAALMSVGADQQLVASKLDEPRQPAAPVPDQRPTGDEPAPEAKVDDNGTLEITHKEGEDAPQPENTEPAPATELPAPVETEDVPEEAPADEPKNEEQSSGIVGGSRFVSEPPSMGGMLTANTQPEGLDPSTDPLSMPQVEEPKLLNRDGTPKLDEEKLPDVVADNLEPDAPKTPESEQPEEEKKEEPKPEPLQLNTEPTPPEAPKSETAPEAKQGSPLPPPPIAQPAFGTTLTDIEASVNSPHLNENKARDEVSRALSSQADSQPPAATHALNAQYLSDSLHGPASSTPPLPPAEINSEPTPPVPQTPPAQQAEVHDPMAPPPVPPPIPFQFNQPGGPSSTP